MQKFQVLSLFGWTTVQHYASGTIEDLPTAEALRLYDGGVVDIIGQREVETAMLAEPSNAMVKPARPRGRPRTGRGR